MLIFNRLLLILTLSVAFTPSLWLVVAFMLGMFIAEFLLPFLAIWPVLVVISWFLPFPYAFWFSWGGVFYVALELLTLEGIQAWPGSQVRLHGLKGTHRKGDRNEYLIVGLIIVIIIVLHFNEEYQATNNFYPYFYQWEQLYREGLIDAYEWRQNRGKVI